MSGGLRVCTKAEEKIFCNVAGSMQGFLRNHLPVTNARGFCLGRSLHTRTGRKREEEN